MFTTRKLSIVAASLLSLATCARGEQPAKGSESVGSALSQPPRSAESAAASPIPEPPDGSQRGSLALTCAGAVMTDDRTLNEITIRCPAEGDHAGLVSITRVTCADGSQVTVLDGASGSARVWCRRATQ
jgi:hypothetical protein